MNLVTNTLLTNLDVNEDLPERKCYNIEDILYANDYTFKTINTYTWADAVFKFSRFFPDFM